MVCWEDGSRSKVLLIDWRVEVRKWLVQEGKLCRTGSTFLDTDDIYRKTTASYGLARFFEVGTSATWPESAACAVASSILCGRTVSDRSLGTLLRRREGRRHPSSTRLDAQSSGSSSLMSRGHSTSPPSCNHTNHLTKDRSQCMTRSNVTMSSRREVHGCACPLPSGRAVQLVSSRTHSSIKPAIRRAFASHPSVVVSRGSFNHRP